MKLVASLSSYTELRKKLTALTHETIQTFKSRAALFRGHRKTVRAYATERERELNNDDNVELESTVPTRFKYLLDVVSEEIAAAQQVDRTNAIAVGALEIGGQAFKNIPATTLLHIESILTGLQKVIDEMPTREAGVAWEPAEDIAKGAWKTKHAEVTQKTERTVYGVILAPATDKFPAQTQSATRDVSIAEISKVMFTGAVSSAEKQQYRERLDALWRIVNEACMTANTVEAVAIDTTLGSAISNFLLGTK